MTRNPLAALFLSVVVFVGCETGEDPATLSTAALMSAHVAGGSWSEPVPLETLNSASTELAPALSSDGLTLYFASDRGGNLDLYVARRACRTCTWSDPAPMDGPINSPANDAGPFLSADGRLFFFNSNRSGSADIYVSRREDGTGGGWSEPVALGPGVNTGVNENHPHYVDRSAEAYAPRGARGVLYFARGGEIRAVGLDHDLVPMTEAHLVAELDDPAFFDGAPSLTADALTIIFHSARPGSQPPDAAAPFFDLWMAHRSSPNDRWSAPVNLGPGVNGVLADLQPAISLDGRTIVFTRILPAGFDLWMTTWTAP